MLVLIVLMGCGKKLGTGLTNHYQGIEKRYNNGQTTMGDKFFMQATYRTGIFGGNFVVPYASRILRRCINGQERDLQLHSRYIKKKSNMVKDKSINTFWFIVLENRLVDVSISEISLNNLLITIRAIISYCFDIYNVIDLGR